MEPDVHVPHGPAPEGTGPAAPGPGAGAGSVGEAPGLREQLSATIDAIRRLVGAHVELAKAELSEIASEVGRLVAAGCAALVLVSLALFLLFLGGVLFLGEALFGSIGWGVLHGTLLFLDLALLGILIGVRIEGRRIGLGLLGALVIGVVSSLLLGAGLTNAGWTALADAVVPTLDPGPRPLIVAVVVAAVVGAVVGLVLGRGSDGGVGGPLVVGLLMGVLVGVLTAFLPGWRVGIALGVTVWLVAWPIIAGADLARTGLDTEAMKARFVPQTTIDTVKETIEWVRERTPLGPRS